LVENYYSLNVADVLKSLKSSEDGLTEREARHRLEHYGPNELEEVRRISPLQIFLCQFKNVLIMILIVAVVLSAFIGDEIEALVIFVIVIFAVLLGFIQEYRAEKAIAALKRMAAPVAMVLRGGEDVEIPGRELVPGDVVLLETGSLVPADMRLLEEFNLRIDEAPLTGESVPVEKGTLPLRGEVPLGDRVNMAYMGTHAVYGRGEGVVVATGMVTEFGKIAGALQELEEKRTPLQENLDEMGKKLAFGALVVVSFIVFMGLMRGEDILEMFIWGVALAVAVVPEALPAVVTISLAIGVKRMVKRNALVRRLPAVETLGSTTFICTDKTGTLTQNKMVVREVFVDGASLEVTGGGYEPWGEFRLDGKIVDHEKHKQLQELLRIGALCNDSRLIKREDGWDIRGDPTEGALVVGAAKGGISQEEVKRHYPRVHEIPFTSARKMMTTVHKTSSGLLAFSKGAPEEILKYCSLFFHDNEEARLRESEIGAILESAEGMARRGLRVMAAAYKTLPEGLEGGGMEEDMVFVGLWGMMDPPRPEARGAIEKCRSAGIKVVMVTGDHKVTAEAVARELGLLGKGRVMTGLELDRIKDEEFEGMVEGVDIYARVSPIHKLKIVDALHKKGHIVAMTGDGVNDAPALKRSDIGVAMGITGTDVTKEAGDLILTDDNFASIVAAVEEGRIVFGNIKKYLMYLLSSNLGEILLMTTAVLVGLPLPLVAVQILYVNLATDGLPALALSVDPPEKEIMRRQPRAPKKSIFAGNVWKLMVIGGVWSAVVNLGIFVWALDYGKSLLEAQSMVFVSLILIQFFKAYNYRSDTQSVFKLGFFTNRWLNLAVLWESLLLLLIIYLPALQGAFNTYSLTRGDWMVAFMAAITIFPVLEVSKRIAARAR
jgi:Ca2+-transporting ATPase